MNNMRIRTGKIIGRDHMARQANCQDTFALQENANGIIGIVCDGCGEGQHSEVGAALAAQFLVQQGGALLTNGTPLTELPVLLHQKTIKFLYDLLKVMQPPHPLEFMRDYLLFTIIGMVITEDNALIFAAGDGTLVIDNDVFPRHQQNAPHYIAYTLFEETRHHHYPSFEVYAIPSDWQRLAIATDGFHHELLSHAWGYSHQRGLQRQMNVWSNQDKHFKDDATLITVEKLCKSS